MVYDVAGPGLVSVIGWAGFLVVSPLIVLVEAVVLLLLRWDGLWRSLLDAFVMNLVSTLAGACILGAGLLFQTPAATWLSLFLAYVLSVVLEGGVLWLMRRRPFGRTAVAAVAANTVSYLGLAVLVAAVSLATA